MPRKYRHWPLPLIAATFVLWVAVAGCSNDDPAAVEEPTDVDVSFNLNVGGQPLQINTATPYTNDAGTKYGIRDLRFIITDVTLHADDGSSFELKDLHYFDVREVATQTFGRTGVPHANWVSVTFTFGLDEMKNVRNRYQGVLPAVMDWPTGFGTNLGYHYMQLEGNFETSPGNTTGYTTHTGARQLGTDPVPIHHYFQADLPFTPAHVHPGGHGELTLNFDLGGWYHDHDLLDGNDTQYDFKALPSQEMMVDLEAQGKLKSNGPFCFSASLEVTDPGHNH